MALQQSISNNDLANGALIRLKQAPSITNLDPPKDDVENLVAEVFVDTRRAAIGSFPWNFAIKRDQLTADTTPPIFGFTKQFTFRNDFLRFLTRHREDGSIIDMEPEHFEIEGFKMLIKDEDATLRYRYIYDHKDITKWPPLFIEFFKLSLAVILAPNFSGGKGAIVLLESQKTDVMAQARAIDGQQHPPRKKQRSRWAASRRGLGHRSSKFLDFR